MPQDRDIRIFIYQEDEYRSVYLRNEILIFLYA